jgi:filamentous hemagglutinin family protein
MKSLLGSRLVLSCSLLCITISLCSIPLSTTQAEVQPPANTSITSSGLNTKVSAPTALPNGKVNYDITGGTRPGGGPNLFHSFGEFSVATNHIANFLNETALPTSNIIGRITGGQVSNIWGTIQTTGFGAANLYLTNPSGFIFGPTASLNVGGSFAATTADYLRMTDGAKFYADPVQPSVLSIGNVAAFGFTNPRPVAISVQATTLQVPTDQMLSLIGGDIVITNSVLRAPSGQINLASVASTGEAIPNQPSQAPSLDVSSFTNLGQITESSVPGPGFVSDLTVSSALGAGTIVIRAGEMTQDHSVLSAQNLSTVDANVIGQDIYVTGDLILRNSSTNVTETINARGAGIQITAGRLQVLNGSQIGTFTRGSGNGGPIDVRANSLLISGVDLSDEAPSSLLSSAIGPAASGTAGDIRVQADSIVVQNGGQIRADLVGGSPGNAGNIDMTAGTVDISTRGLIAASAVEGTGPAGRVDITAHDVRISGVVGTVDPVPNPDEAENMFLEHPVIRQHLIETFGFDAATGITTSTNAGRGGELTLTADTLAITDHGAMTSRTIGSGDAGTIDLHIANNVKIMKGGIVSASTSGTGVGGNISLATDTLMLSDGGILSTSTFGVVPEAAGGTIRVDATTVSLTGGSQIASDSFGPGDGGTIHITASDLVTLTGIRWDGVTPSQVTANAQSTGKPGDIMVMTKNLTERGGAAIAAEGSGPAGGGSVYIKATETVSLLGESADALIPSGLFATTNSTALDAGDAGSVTVEAKNLFMGDGAATIAAYTFGGGDGGTINITVAEAMTISGVSRDGLWAAGLFADNISDVPVSGIGHQGSILGPGNGGNIFVTAKDLTVEGGGWISVGSWGTGKGGNIHVTATERLTLTGRSPDGGWPSALIANARSGASDAGDAGNIVVETKELIIEGGAQITSATFGPGAGGAIQVTATEAVTLTGVGISGDTVFASGLSTASVSESPGAGDAGNLVLVTKNLTLGEGAQITTSTSGSGKGGTLTVNATGPVALTGPGSGLFTDSKASGTGGNINVRAARMTMDNGASVSAASSGTGDAGTITINAGSEFQSTNSSVTTEATQASGGNITLLATDMIRLRDSMISASVIGGPTTAGGNILIDPNFIILQNSQIIAQAIQGAGGNINLAFNQALLADPRSTISASSEFGVSGTVNINSPTQNLSGALVPLEQSFLSGNTLSNQRCAARMAEGQISTFIVTEHEGLPQEPGGMLLSGLVETDGTAASETLEPIRVASVSHPPFTPLSPEPVQLTWSHDTCRRLTSKGSER